MSHFSPPPQPPQPTENFDIDAFLLDIWDLMRLLQPIIWFSMEFMAVLWWTSVMKSFIVLVVFITCCLYPGFFPVLMSLLLIRYIILNKVVHEWSKDITRNDTITIRGKSGGHVTLVKASKDPDEANGHLSSWIKSLVNTGTRLPIVFICFSFPILPLSLSLGFLWHGN